MTENTTTEAEALVLLGLRHALTDATKDLYHVFASSSESEREARFLRGVERHLAAHDRMRKLVWELIQKEGKTLPPTETWKQSCEPQGDAQ